MLQKVELKEEEHFSVFSVRKIANVLKRMVFKIAILLPRERKAGFEIVKDEGVRVFLFTAHIKAE